MSAAQRIVMGRRPSIAVACSFHVILQLIETVHRNRSGYRNKKRELASDGRLDLIVVAPTPTYLPAYCLSDMHYETGRAYRGDYSKVDELFMHRSMAPIGLHVYSSLLSYELGSALDRQVA